MVGFEARKSELDALDIGIVAASSVDIDFPVDVHLDIAVGAPIWVNVTVEEQLLANRIELEPTKRVRIGRCLSRPAGTRAEGEDAVVVLSPPDRIGGLNGARVGEVLGVEVKGLKGIDGGV